MASYIVNDNTKGSTTVVIDSSGRGLGLGAMRASALASGVKPICDNPPLCGLKLATGKAKKSK